MLTAIVIYVYSSIKMYHMWADAFLAASVHPTFLNSFVYVRKLFQSSCIVYCLVPRADFYIDVICVNVRLRPMSLLC